MGQHNSGSLRPDHDDHLLVRVGVMSVVWPVSPRRLSSPWMRVSAPEPAVLVSNGDSGSLDDGRGSEIIVTRSHLEAPVSQQPT
jgi:hypothetical protein